MTLNTSAQDNQTLRREKVASLRLRGLTLREITLSLAQQNPPVVNPQTGKPYSAVTILNDLEALKDEWRANAAQDTDVHQARELAEIVEIKRAAWSQKDPELALKALDREMKILGTMKQPGGVNITINLEVVTRFEAVAKAAGVDASKALDEFTQMIERKHADSSRG